MRWWPWSRRPLFPAGYVAPPPPVEPVPVPEPPKVARLVRERGEVRRRLAEQFPGLAPEVLDRAAAEVAMRALPLLRRSVPPEPVVKEAEDDVA